MSKALANWRICFQAMSMDAVVLENQWLCQGILHTVYAVPVLHVFTTSIFVLIWLLFSRYSFASQQPFPQCLPLLCTLRSILIYSIYPHICLTYSRLLCLSRLDYTPSVCHYLVHWDYSVFLAHQTQFTHLWLTCSEFSKGSPWTCSGFLPLLLLSRRQGGKWTLGSL